MSRLTVTEKRLINQHKRSLKISLLSDWLKPVSSNTIKSDITLWCMFLEAIIFLFTFLGCLCTWTWSNGVLIAWSIMPALWLSIIVICAPFDVLRNRRRFRNRYLGWNDLESGMPDFHNLYHAVVGSRCPETALMRGQLAEVCGDTTARYMEFKAEHVDMWSNDIQTWLRADYDRARQLAMAIVDYDNELEQITADERARAQKILEDQIEYNRRISRQAAMKRFQQEQDAKAELLAQGFDPLKDSIDALRYNTERLKQLQSEMAE